LFNLLAAAKCLTTAEMLTTASGWLAATGGSG